MKKCKSDTGVTLIKSASIGMAVDVVELLRRMGKEE